MLQDINKIGRSDREKRAQREASGKDSEGRHDERPHLICIFSANLCGYEEQRKSHICCNINYCGCTKLLKKMKPEKIFRNHTRINNLK